MIAAILLATLLDDHAAAIAASKLKYVAVNHELKDAIGPPSCIGLRNDRRLITINGEKQYAEYPPNKALDAHLRAGRKAYYDGNFNEAAKEAQQAIAIASDDSRPWILRAAAMFKKEDWIEAKIAYHNATRIDPTLTLAHLYAAGAHLDLEENDEAIDEMIELLTYDPLSFNMPDAFLALVHDGYIALHAYPFRPPRGLVGVAHRGTVEIDDDPEWRAYGNCKAVWRNEADYRRTKRGVDAPYEWTVAEERECVTAYVLGNLEEAKKRLPADASNRDVMAALPPLAQHILVVTDAGLLDGFIIYAAIGQRCSSAIPLLPDNFIAKEREYIRRFIVVKK